jgi:large subunit ribosomal protein L23
MGIFNKKTEEKVVATSEKKVVAKDSVTEKPATADKQVSRYSLQSIILGPVISEKSARLHAQHQYVLSVAPRANKIEVKKALKAMYNVDAVSVQMIKIQGKNVRRVSGVGRTNAVKKAIVTLKGDQKITVFEGV